MKINIFIPKNLKKEKEKERKQEEFRKRKFIIIRNVILLQIVYLFTMGTIEQFVSSKILKFILQNYIMGWYFICPYWFFCDAFHTMHLLNKRFKEEMEKYK